MEEAEGDGGEEVAFESAGSVAAVQWWAEGFGMQIPILIERVDGNGYRSRGGEQFELSARGATREEVLAELQEQLRKRLESGAEVVSLEVTVEPHPLAGFAGMFKDDPLFESWQRSIKKYRRDVDADPDYP